MPDTAAERPRVYLNKVHLKGFKSIEDLTIDIQKGLNILIGKNGSGKSNFLDFLNQVILFSETQQILYKYAQLEFVSDDNHSFIIETEREAYLKAGKKKSHENVELSERLYIDNNIVFDYNSPDENLRKLVNFKDQRIMFRGISRGLFHTLGYKHIYPLLINYNLPENLGTVNLPGTLKASILDDTFFWTFPKTLTFIDGIFWNLDQFFEIEQDKLYSVTPKEVLTHLTLYDYILENLKRYTSIEDVRFNPNLNIYYEEKSLIVDNVKLDFKINGNWLPWSQLSDGTRRLFYIISEVTYNEGIVLIEEPELGIHPHQFSLLMDFLKEQAEDKQIIISTHSPKALDILSPEELNNILIAYYDKSKGTQIRHLTEKEEQKAKRYTKEVGFFSDYWLLSDLE